MHPTAQSTPPSGPHSLRLQVRGTWKTLKLPMGDSFLESRGDEVVVSPVQGPNSAVCVRQTAEGLLVAPGMAGAILNGRPLAAPQMMGKLDLLEVAGLTLSTAVGSSSEELAPGPIALPPEVATPPTEKRFAGRYDLQGELGRGGFGVVYKAWDTQLQRPVALKVLLQSEGRSLQRFVREIRASAALRHEGLVTVYDSGIADEHPFLVMELVEGKPLSDLAAEGITATQAASVLCQVTRALAYAHRQGLLHRDIKPANIMVRPDGRAVLLDFGLVRVAESDEVDRITRTGVRLGTLPYMSPEQAFGSKVDERSEVYGLGATLYHALTGQYPFVDAGEDILVAIINEQPKRPSTLQPGLPPDLEAICLKCMEKRSRDRYPTAANLAVDLQRFLDGEPTEARPLTPLGRRWRWFRRSRRAQLTTAAIAVGVLVAIGLAVYASTRADLVALRDTFDEEKERREKLAKELRATLAEVEAGARKVDEETISAFVRAGEDPAVEILNEVLIALAVDLQAVEERVWLGANKLQEGEETIVGLEAAVKVKFSVDMGTIPTQEHSRSLNQAVRRLTVRARLSRAPSPPLYRVMSAAQNEAIPEVRFEAAKLACLALGRLESQAGVVALSRYLRVEWDVDRAVEAGRALIRLSSPRGSRHLVSAFRRFGPESQFSYHLSKDLSALAPHVKTDKPRDYLDKATLLLLGGDVEGGRASLDQAIAGDPLLTDAYLLRATARERLGDSHGALEDLSEAIKLAPHSHAPWNNRAGLRLRGGDFRTALRDARKSEELEPFSPHAQQTLSTILRELGRLEEALEASSEAIRLNPYAASYRTSRAALRRQMLDHAGAKKDAEAALRLDKSDSIAISILGGLLLEEGQPQAALENMNRALELAPGIPGHYFNRGRCHEAMGNFEAALTDYDAYINKAPNGRQVADTLYLRVGIRFRQRKLDLTRKDLDRLLKLKPDHDKALYMSSILFRLDGKLRQAERHLARYTALKPEDAKAWADLADTRFRLRDLSGGNAALSKATHLAPESLKTLEARARGHFVHRRLKLALRDYDVLVEKLDRYYHERSVLREFTGDLHGARRDLERHVRRNPNDKTARTRLDELIRKLEE